jgi:hypothetical protein
MSHGTSVAYTLHQVLQRTWLLQVPRTLRSIQDPHHQYHWQAAEDTVNKVHTVRVRLRMPRSAKQSNAAQVRQNTRVW